MDKRHLSNADANSSIDRLFQIHERTKEQFLFVHLDATVATIENIKSINNVVGYAK